VEIMSRLRNLGKAFGAGKGPWERRLLLWAAGAIVFAAVVIAGAYYFDVATESDEFCGTICHANFPEYATNQVSAHANVECGTCHIGPGLVPKVAAKVYGVAEMIAQLANTYHRPIELPVARMLPADVMCEQCHSPQGAGEDEIRAISYFADDEVNTETESYLILWAGGQQEPGAHWHVDHKVSYVARDALAQDIPWVGVMEDGEWVAYQAEDMPLTADQLSSMPRQEMDCLDCHNRTAHDFRDPERSIDEALARGRLDSSLPYLKREAAELLAASYTSRGEAMQAIAGLGQFYRSQYPEVFTAKQLSIEQAVAELQIIYSYSIFPYMNLTSDVYPDNFGHANFPGCFRCHDGQHLNEQGESIPLDCDACHSLPAVIKDGQDPVTLSIEDVAAQAEPIPGIPHRLDEEMDACLHCHGAGGLQPVPTTHQPIQRLLNEPCTLCHTVEPGIAAPAVSHDVEGRDNCLACHSEAGAMPVPADHTGRLIESCLVCHEVE
jgi:hypothetical protein